MTVQETTEDKEVAELLSLCPTYVQAIDLLSKKWMGLILMVLLKGPKRFNELLAIIPGLSDPLLTQRLRELETQGIVARRVLATSPVRVEYELTEMGRDFQKVAMEISRWAHKWLDSDQANLSSEAKTN